jgi:hypothetical protein
VTKLVELRKLLDEAEVAHVTKVGQLAFLVGNISTVLVDLCMPPIPRSPRDPGKASHILEEAGTILERLREAYSFGVGTWD